MDKLGSYVPGRFKNLLFQARTYGRGARHWNDNRSRNRFVVFAQGRSGTTLICDLLDQHPAVTCAQEILYHRQHFPRLYIEGCCADSPSPCYGFKLKVYQLTENQGVSDPNAFLSRMHHDGWQVVHLWRSQLVRHAISALVADRKSVWHVTRESGNKVVRNKVVIPVQQLERAIAERENWAVLEKQALRGIPHVSVQYEEHLLRPDAREGTLARIFGFLGVPAVAVKSSLQRTSTNYMGDLVANYTELYQHFSATRHAVYFDDPLADQPCDSLP